jgi:hypothetical protein
MPPGRAESKGDGTADVGTEVQHMMNEFGLSNNSINFSSVNIGYYRALLVN